MSVILTAITALLLSSTFSTAATMEKGRWETTAREQAPGGSAPARVDIACVDKEIDGEKLVFGDITNDPSCKITKEEHDSGVLYFEMHCVKDGIASVQKGTIHSTGTTLDMAMDIIIDLSGSPMIQEMMGGATSMKTTFVVNAKRIGKCDGTEVSFDQ